MGTAEKRTRRARGSIDPEKILDGAFEIAQRDGLDSLSMPVLAAQLDVGVTSIYWYFRNKEDLLRRMSERALVGQHGQLPSPEGRAPERWKEFLREYFTAQWQSHQSDDLLTDITLFRTATYSRRATHVVYQDIEGILSYLVSAGFALSNAWYLVSTCSIYTRGFIIAERNRRQNLTPPDGRMQLNLLDVESMPLLTQLVSEESVIIDMTGEPAFEFALEGILDQAEHILGRDRGQVAAG